jgi:RNA polymerase sigma factor (sigma-70 family)
MSDANEEFETFFRGSYDRVFKGAFATCGDWSIAEDATQEAFARAYARWRRLQEAPWVEGWVMTTALNEARRLLRHGRRIRAPMPAHAMSSQDRVNDFAAPLDQRESIRRAILQLPERPRTALILFYMCDLSTASIARLMGCAEGTARSHLTSARQRLGDLLGPKEDGDEYA